MFANRKDKEKPLRHARRGFLCGGRAARGIAFLALLMALLTACLGAAAEDKGSIFEGTENEANTFDPAEVVTLEMHYEYSKTGSLAGIDAAAPQTVKAVAALLDDNNTPDDPSDDRYELTFDLPATPAGFRVVLNPERLNEFVVNPPKGDETAEQLAEMLENGSFNVDVNDSANPVYYIQQHPGVEENQKYGNRYSDKYNVAWNEARVRSNDAYTARAVCGMPHGDENHGANALVNPKLVVTLTRAQLVAAQANGLSITVYYRRNATWYTVNHWVPENLSGLTDPDDYETKTENGTNYVRLVTDTLQGRIGATTRAAAKTGADNPVFTLLSPMNFSQRQIEATGTVVDIFYEPATEYRVIFDTNYTYIPRQTVALGGNVDFTDVAMPTRQGYTFAGWRYLNKDATPGTDGQYADDAYTLAVVLDADGSYTGLPLTISPELVGELAQIVTTDGVPALHLYPLWKPATTTVRVVLWTEDLTGTDDVQRFTSGQNEGAAPTTHLPNLNGINLNYSNVGSFTMNVATDSTLLDSSAQERALASDIQNQVGTQFNTFMGSVDGIAVNQFYEQAGFQIAYEEASGIRYDTTTASADGKTTINVYFTRNVYELLFTYYGAATVNGVQSANSVAISTNGYSFSNGAAVPNGNLTFNYTTSHNGGNGTNYANGWMRAADTITVVPQTVTIRAKYGANLRDVWPVAQSNQYFTSLDNQGNRGQTVRMISWATTDGKYCEAGRFGSGSSHAGEPTIHGAYAAMSAEIVADPTRPNYRNGVLQNDGLRHNLVAYWFNGAISYYRYNHCYELPDLAIDSSVQRVVIFGNDANVARNVLYLVPTDDARIAQYDFGDLMRVSYTGGQIDYNVENGGYYAVRAYNGKYYAVARQVDTVSSNAISAQNPSARLHMTRANGTPDHSERYNDKDGAYNGTTCGTADDPYDLYFYYDRDRYTITYMAPYNAENSAETEVTLGTITLPYGAQVTRQKYGFELGYKDTNVQTNDDGTPKYPWTTTSTVAVCPDRDGNGTKAWTFKGWALGPAGVNMQWSYPAGSSYVAPFAIEGNLRLYAIWNAPTYTVTFHLNGGTENGSTGDITVNVPANTRYSANGAIPRPLFQGYTFDGWYDVQVDVDGNAVLDADGNAALLQTEFDFDQNIISDLHVGAKWTQDVVELFDYQVYHVTATQPADTSFGTVQIGNGSDFQTYYLLEAVETQRDQAYTESMVLHLSPKAFAGYVPQNTGVLLTPEKRDPASPDTIPPSNIAIFYYAPVVPEGYTVRFIKAGTEGANNDGVLALPDATRTVNADRIRITPDSDMVQKLLAQGYGLVNRGADGTYSFVTNYGDLEWIDAGNTAHPSTNMTNVDTIPDYHGVRYVNYLVDLIPFTVTYENAAGSPTGAKAALEAVTAAQNTPVENANGKNPTQYDAGDSFTVTNPERFFENGVWYEFDHWSLGEGTTIKDSSDRKFKTLNVGTGTTGNLTFVANWTEVPTNSLTVRKTAVGLPADQTNKAFTFTLTLKDYDDNQQPLTGTYAYTKTPSDDPTNNPTGAGSFTLDNGQAEFTLKHNQSITITDLPVGAEYTVNETPDPDYTLAYDGNVNSEIIANPPSTHTVAAVNTGLGDLRVSKMVVGETTDKRFRFTVTLTNADTPLSGTFACEGTAHGAETEGDLLTNLTLNNGQAAFWLAHGEEIVIKDLPSGTAYEVTEDAAQGYVSTHSVPRVGTIGAAGSDVAIPFTNTRTDGLTISKSVRGGQTDLNEQFTFNIHLTDENGNLLSGTYSCTDANQAARPDLSVTDGEAAFTLKAGESITINGLRVGTKYTVTEKNPSSDYTVTYNGQENSQEATIVNGTNHVDVVNTRKTGGLIVAKTVAGPETKENFSFNLKLSGDGNLLNALSYNYSRQTYDTEAGDWKESSKNTFTPNPNGNNFLLAHNERIVIKGLPVGVKYSLVEDLTNTPNYTTDLGSNCENIPVEAGEKLAEILVKNTRKTGGSLTVSKTVSGNGAEVKKPFSFTLTLTDAGVPLKGSYAYTTSDDPDVENRLDLNEQGQAAFTLKHGQSITITGLPVGAVYSVVEAAEPNYTVQYGGVAAANAHGSISADGNAVAVENIHKTGDLIVSKQVSGFYTDNDAFTFTVRLMDANNHVLTGTYDCVKQTRGDDGSWTDSATGTVTPDANGNGFTLKRNERFVIKALPVGAAYSVLEADEPNYTVTCNAQDAAEAAGTIMEGENRNTAAFVNTRKTTALTLSKTVKDDDGGADPAQRFEFTITLDAAINGEYSNVTFQNGEARVQLFAGGSKTISGLPVGVGFEVEEVPLDPHYTPAYTNQKNTLAENAHDNRVEIVNTYVPDTGDLVVTKQVEGDGANANQEFTFQVTLKGKDGKPLTGEYKAWHGTIRKNERLETKVTLDAQGSASFTLKAGGAFTLCDLPVDTQYAVTEARAENYEVSSRDASGVVDIAGVKAEFVNTYKEPEPDVPKTDVIVTKIWNDEGYDGRPDAFTVSFSKDGVHFHTRTIRRDEPSTRVSADGNTWTFYAQWNEGSYEVEELDVPGYVSSVVKEGNHFTITNTYMPKTSDDRQILRYILLAGCGLALLAADWRCWPRPGGDSARRDRRSNMP